jgi:WD40 repeat protein
MTLPRSPFKGLAYFGDSETDWLFFFGRERESELVAANLMASRLTVLYGPSGVGKSSLLRAGVTRRLRSLVPSVDALGGGAEIVIVDSWRDDPVAAVAAAAGARTDIPLADALSERAAAAGGELYLVLDQMEEYMLYHGRDGGPLAAELEDVLTRTDVPVHVLLGVRDDALADLDVLKRRVPGLFANVLRLDHLTRAAARSAIEGPLRAYVELGGPEVTAEEELIEAVLDEVAAGRIERHLTGRGLVEESERTRRVEAPYLQLVMERIWDVERGRGSDVLGAATLAELGGAERIVEEHLERALEGLDEDERDLVARLFNHLVTPSGTKIAHAVDDLARYARVDADGLGHVLGTLEAARILRRVPGRSGGPPRYEIFHDVLAPAVLAWRSRRELESERATARRRHRRLAFVAVLALVALAGTLALAAWALAQRAEAHKQAQTALSRELTALALTELDSDPELSLALATEASRLNSSRRVETVLVRSLAASRVRAVLTAPGPVESLQIANNQVVAGLQGGGLYVADVRLRQGAKLDLARTLVGVSGDDILVGGPAGLELRSVPGGALVRRLPLRPGAVVPVRDVETGIVTSQMRLPAPFKLAALGPKGTLVAVSDGTRRTVVVNALTGDARYVLEQPSAVTSLAWGPGARILATGGKDGSALLWRLSTGRPFARLPGHQSAVTRVAFSPRATIVATASRDATARVWKIGSITPITVLAGHTNPLTDIAFSPDGVLVATASTDRTAEVRTYKTGAIAAILAGHHETVTGVRFVGNAHVVTASADGTLRRWNVEGAPLLRLVRHLSEPVARVSFAGRDRFEAVTADGERLVLARDGEVLERGRAEQPAPSRAPDGTTASIEGNVVVLHRPGGDDVTLVGHTLPVTAVRFSPDGARAVTTSRDADARLWDTRTGALVHTLRGHFGIVSDAAFSPDGRWLVTAGPQRAALWDAASGARLFYLRGHMDIVTSVAFDATGRRIVTGGREGDVRTYRCDICTSGAELLRTAEARLALTGRKLTQAERAEYLTER